MSKLLFAENPLVVNPVLAARIGINEAIVLQQIHYWIEINRKKDWNFYEGRHWTYETQEDWLKQFPWLKLRSLQRVISGLKGLGLILVRQFDAKDWKQRNYYTIDYEALENLPEKPSNPVKSDAAKLAASKATNWRHQERQIGGMIYTEISTENSSKNSQQEKRTSALRDRVNQNSSSSNPEPEEPASTKSSSLSNKAKKTASSKDPDRDQNVPAFLPPPENVDGLLATDKDGWLQLPRHKDFATARFLAARRLQAVLSFSVIEKGAEVALEGEEEVQRKGSEFLIYCIQDDLYLWESEAFAPSGNLSLRRLRNCVYAYDLVTQERFNEMLRHLFERSLEWCRKMGDRSAEILATHSPIELFAADDIDGFKLLCPDFVPIAEID
jgi:hypothetical protein